MRIILHKSSNPGETGQSARGLIPMDYTELGHADRQLLVTSISAVEDQAMTGAVHRLERPFFLIDIQGEHIVLVVLRMPGRFPQLGVIHVWRDDWLHMSNSCLGTKE